MEDKVCCQARGLQSQALCQQRWKFYFNVIFFWSYDYLFCTNCCPIQYSWCPVYHYGANNHSSCDPWWCVVPMLLNASSHSTTTNLFDPCIWNFIIKLRKQDWSGITVVLCWSNTGNTDSCSSIFSSITFDFVLAWLVTQIGIASFISTIKALDILLISAAILFLLLTYHYWQMTLLLHHPVISVLHLY